jgi:hypothetical protein
MYTVHRHAEKHGSLVGVKDLRVHRAAVGHEVLAVVSNSSALGHIVGLAFGAIADRRRVIGDERELRSLGRTR